VDNIGHDLVEVEPVPAPIGLLQGAVAAVNGQQQVPPVANAQVAEVHAGVDEPARRRAKHVVARSIARLAKAEFGIISNNVANAGMARVYMLREAKRIHVRKSHLESVMVWAVYYFWLPSVDESAYLRRVATAAYTLHHNRLTVPGKHKRVSWMPGWICGYYHGFSHAPK
jgi:hypothetical protein